MRLTLVPRVGGAAAACALVLSAAAASAATFDPKTGKLTLDAAGFHDGLDRGDALTIKATARDRSPVDASVIAARFVTDAQSLEGTGVFLVGAELIRTMIDLAPLSAKLSSRRVDFRVWVQPRGTGVDAFVLWPSGLATPLGVRLVPTGRGTDDGFRELATGPIDFDEGGLSPMLVLRDTQLTGSSDDPFAFEGGDASIHYDSKVRAAVDAFEVVDLGPRAVEKKTCTSVTETSVCGASGTCLYGVCVDATAAYGTLPSKDVRAAFVDRVSFLYDRLEGGRAAQKHVADYLATLGLAGKSDDPRAFWAAFPQLDGLADAHAYPFRGGAAPGFDTGICLGLGVADLLPGATSAAVPMVFAAESTHDAGKLVQPGDVLVKVDGLAVDVWEAAHRRRLYAPGDVASRPLALAEALPGAALDAGAVLTFARCDRASHSATPCTAAEVKTFDVDLAALVGKKMWSGALVDADLKAFPCDSRFSRAFPDADSYTYPFAGSKDLDASTRLIHINGVPAETYPGGKAYKTALEAAVADVRPFIILDERVGGGGWFEPAFSTLFGSLFSPTDRARAEMIPGLEEASLPKVLDRMRACLDAVGDGSSCGFYENYVYDATVGTHNNQAAKLAVLLGIDVSGNDFLTRLVKQRTGPTRLFGPVSTYGGFGRITFLPTLGIAISGGTVQIQDGIFTVDDVIAPFESSTGVKPDEVVLEKQSDAIVGRDTLMEAARAWLAK